MSRGYQKYWSDFWNYPQLMIFCLYVVYFVSRVSNPDNTLIPVLHKENEVDLKCHIEGATTESIAQCEAKIQRQEHMEFYWIVMNSTILISSAFYCMFYARIFEQFGRMVKLIGAVFNELIIFMIFFGFWNLMFCWLTRIAG